MREHRLSVVSCFSENRISNPHHSSFSQTWQKSWVLFAQVAPISIPSLFFPLTLRPKLCRFLLPVGRRSPRTCNKPTPLEIFTLGPSTHPNTTPIFLAGGSYNYQMSRLSHGYLARPSSHSGCEPAVAELLPSRWRRWREAAAAISLCSSRPKNLFHSS